MFNENFQSFHYDERNDFVGETVNILSIWRIAAAEQQSGRIEQI
jgi:hypothetical protein